MSIYTIDNNVKLIEVGTTQMRHLAGVHGNRYPPQFRYIGTEITDSKLVYDQESRYLGTEITDEKLVYDQESR